MPEYYDCCHSINNCSQVFFIEIFYKGVLIKNNHVLFDITVTIYAYL